MQTFRGLEFMDEEVEDVVGFFEDEFLDELAEDGVDFVFLQILLDLLVVLNLLFLVHRSYNLQLKDRFHSDIIILFITEDTMSLTQADLNILSESQYTQLPIGVVAVYSFSKPFPEGWERLSYEEAIPYIESLKQLLGEWSIVAFKVGKIDGPGYGSQINPDYS